MSRLPFTNLPLKRKYRWVLETMDDKEQSLFQGFVRVDSRPPTPLYESDGAGGIRQASCPGELSLRQSLYSEAELAAVIEAAPRIARAILRLYDGVGALMEEWRLTGLQARLEDCSDVIPPESVWDLSWTLAFDNFAHTNHSLTPRWKP